MVSNIVWNEKKPFNPATFENDFVILKLKGRLQFGDDVQPAYLPESHQIDLIKAKDQCFVSGFGSVEQGNS